jgi:hypothetical protein
MLARRKYTATIAGSGCFLVIATLFWFNPAVSSFYPLCWFHKLTGLHCPACGSLRALHQLLHGHIATAFDYNALLVVSLPIIALLFLQKRLRSKSGADSKRPWRWFGWIMFSAAIIFGVLRNLPFPVVAWMSP